MQQLAFKREFSVLFNAVKTVNAIFRRKDTAHWKDYYRKYLEKKA